MDRSEAVAALPEAYRQAIEHRDAGATVAEVAASLGIDVHAVAPLLEIAGRKLARLCAQDTGEPRPTLDAELGVGVVEVGLDGPD